MGLLDKEKNLLPLTGHAGLWSSFITTQVTQSNIESYITGDDILEIYLNGVEVTVKSEAIVERIRKRSEVDPAKKVRRNIRF